MYAIVESGGKQYKVEPEEELFLEKIEGKPGKKIQFDRVLMLAGNGEIKLGGELEKAKVGATIVEQTRGKKVIVFKYKSKKNYRRKRGHRQFLTKVRIDEIIGLSKQAKSGQATSRPAPAKAAGSTVKKAAPAKKAEKPAQTKGAAAGSKATAESKASGSAKSKPAAGTRAKASSESEKKAPKKSDKA